MARYIDAEMLIAHLKDALNECEISSGSRANGKGIAYNMTLGLKSAISCVEMSPTADVAPKSEVALGIIRKVKNKVRKYKHNVVNPYEHIILYLNELEKKYTEGEA